MNLRLMVGAAGVLALTSALGGCATTETTAAPAPMAKAEAVMDEGKFDADRQAILAMAGDYKVTFDFIETVPLAMGYDLKDRKKSGAYEVVRVIEDRGDFISLQHILLVGGDTKFALKHWRQDWTYEPEEVLTFIGGNAWEMQPVPAATRKGKWAQEVYQVDDSPRYGAVGAWETVDGVTAWTPERAWRALPRRDMTTRDDYHAVDAVNRHALTWFGWVHEQDNIKLVLSGDEPGPLVRELGVNTYRTSDEFDPSIADEQWEATKGYWAAVRAEWEKLEASGKPFGLTVKGEPEPLYQPLLEYASELADGYTTEAEAIADAKATIAEFTTTDLPPLAERLRD